MYSERILLVGGAGSGFHLDSHVTQGIAEILSFQFVTRNF